MNKQGKLTPSCFADIMIAGRAKADRFGKTAWTYAYKVACERLGVEFPEVWAKAMEWGVENELDAIEAYQTQTGQLVTLNDVIQHPTLDYVAGTPDGLIGEDGIIEVKCPYNSVNHLMNLKSGAQIEDYKYQIQGYLWITGRKWCDFVSYDPRFKKDLQLAIYRVDRDQLLIDELAARVQEFEETVMTEIMGGLESWL
jgi:hypothetical protein